MEVLKKSQVFVFSRLRGDLLDRGGDDTSHESDSQRRLVAFYEII